MGRNTLANVEIRQADVFEMLVRGTQTREIIVKIQDKYGVKKGTVESDITVCYSKLKSYIQRNIDDIVAQHVQRYETIYDAAFSIGDFRNCIAALKEIEALLKVREQQPLVTVNNNTLNIDGLTVEQIKSILHSNVTTTTDTAQGT